MNLTSKQAEDGSKRSIKEVEFTVYLDMERRQVQTTKETEKFKKKISDLIKAGFVKHQVFDGGETGLFFRMLSNRTFITEEEKTLPGH